MMQMALQMDRLAAIAASQCPGYLRDVSRLALDTPGDGSKAQSRPRSTNGRPLAASLMSRKSSDRGRQFGAAKVYPEVGKADLCPWSENPWNGDQGGRKRLKCEDSILASCGRCQRFTRCRAHPDDVLKYLTKYRICTNSLAKKFLRVICRRSPYPRAASGVETVAVAAARACDISLSHFGGGGRVEVLPYARPQRWALFAE
jgi:hypothetical protein